jgi:hypothetical protein
MRLDVGTEDYVNVEGALVEKDALLIAERLAEYDPNLYVICLDPNHVDAINDAPFIIAEQCEDGKMRRIFECWELNNSVLDRVMQADTSKYDVLTDMDKINAKFHSDNKQRYEEIMLENAEQAKAVLRSTKSSYTLPNAHGGISKIHYNRPAERIS